MLLPQSWPYVFCHVSSVSVSCNVLNQTAVYIALLYTLFYSMQTSLSIYLVSIAWVLMHCVLFADQDKHINGRCPYNNISMQMHEQVMMWSSWYLPSCSKQSSCSKSKDGLAAFSRSVLQHVVCCVEATVVSLLCYSCLQPNFSMPFQHLWLRFMTRQSAYDVLCNDSTTTRM